MDSTTNIADTRPGNPRKLRQTCNPCSEAKVKCDKGNPCSRCYRLSYNCVYSPARRIGRPRPNSRRFQDQDGGRRPARDDVAANIDHSAPTPTPAPSLPPTTTRHLLATGSRSNGIPQSTSTSTRDNLSSLGQPSSPGMDEVRHSPYEYDCTALAVETLKKLSAAGLDSQQSATTGTVQTTQTAAAADVLANQIPHACRQAIRILVCPCSADMDTALLAASLTTAILDAAGTALRTLKPAGHALDDEQHTVLALSTIPNISRVVTLFKHRYSISSASRPTEALLLLTLSFRTTLEAIAEDMTSRFLDSSAAPSLCSGSS